MVKLIAIIAIVIAAFALVEILQAYLSEKEKRQAKQKKISQRLKELEGSGEDEDKDSE